MLSEVFRTASISALLAFLAAPGAGAASLFSVNVSGVTNQGPFGAQANNGFTDSVTTGSWSGSAVASGGGAGARLVTATGDSQTYAFYCGQNACTVARATASTSDTARILPTGLAPAGTPINVRFDVTLDGSVFGNGGWSAYGSLNVNGVGDGISEGTGGTVGAYNLTVHKVKSFNRTLLVGTNYSLDTYLDIGAFIRGAGPWPYGITVDFLNTLTVDGVVLTDGVGPLQLLGDSGRDYFVAATVPAPAAGWLLATACGVIAALRRRGARHV